jgi:cell division protein FtsW
MSARESSRRSESIEHHLLVFVTAALAGLGVLMVFSSSFTPRPSFADQDYLIRQVGFLTAGSILALVASQLPPAFWRRAATPLFLMALVALVAVLVPGIGARVNGARRWFRVGSVGIQPSEFARVIQVLFLARLLAGWGDRVQHFFTGLLPMLLPVALLSGLVLVEPDFGSAVLACAMGVVMLFLGGMRWRHLLAVVAAVAPAAVYLVMAEPYRMRRVLEFVEGWRDPASATYQVRQSLLALGSGGLWGTGLGSGWQKLGFLPEANTDFVFAVIGEELGFVGTMAVLVMWSVFLVSGLRVAWRVAERDRCAFLAASGLVVQLVAQAAIHIAVVTSCLPPKGISLPFVSAGGSGLTASLWAVGIVLALTRPASAPAARHRTPKAAEADDGDSDEMTERLVEVTAEHSLALQTPIRVEAAPATFKKAPSRRGTGRWVANGGKNERCRFSIGGGYPTLIAP